MLWIMLAGGLAAAIGTVGLRVTTNLLSNLPPNQIRFSFTAEPGTVTRLIPNAAARIPEFALSRNGREIIFQATDPDGVNRYWIRSIDQLHAKPVSDAEGSGQGFLFWSPDSRRVVAAVNGRLRVLGQDGEPSMDLCDASEFRGGSWASDGTIVFARNNVGLWKVRANAPGECQRLAAFPSSAIFPMWVDDGAHLLFTLGRATNGQEPGIYVATADGGALRRVLRDRSRAIVVQGHILFVRNHVLVAQHFDLQGLRVTGEPRAIASNMHLSTEYWAAFDASETGVLA